MATIYNSSFHCNRIQIYETSLSFIVSTAFKIFRRSILGTCSTWGSVAEDSAGNLPLSPITNYLAGFRGSIFFLCRGPS